MTALAVRALELSHFRSHKALRLALDPRPIAIFGPNGAGKTNVLEAVSLLSPGRGLRRAGAEEIMRQPEALGWKLGAEIDSLGHSHDISVAFTPQAGRSLTIDDKTAPQTALGRIARIVWLIPAMDRLWIEGADGRRRFLDRMTLSFEPGHGEAVLTYEKAMRERNRLLKDNVTDAAWYSALETQMAEAGTAITRARLVALERVSAAQTAAETAFPAADLTLAEAEERTPETDPGALAEAFATSRRADLAAGRTLVGPHRADLAAIYRDKGIAAKQCSTGEQKALLLSLILSNARALAAEIGAPPLLLLDEVSAHLDPDRRRALYDEICALMAQAWMTGTEAELFADLGERAQLFDISALSSDGAI